MYAKGVPATSDRMMTQFMWEGKCYCTLQKYRIIQIKNEVTAYIKQSDLPSDRESILYAFSHTHLWPAFFLP